MLLGGLRDELADIDISRARHLARVKELDNRRVVVQLQLDQYTYPVITLPPEITSEIFVQCLPGGDYICPHLSHAPLVFLAVCRAWRKFALATPSLWSSLDIFPGMRTLETSKEPIRSWFDRASNLPLSFRFSGEPRHKHFEDGLNPILYRYARRLSNLELRLNPRNLITLDAKTEFPLLRRLDLQWLGRAVSVSDGHIEAFGMAPQLRTLSLNNVPPSALSIPWEQLTNIEFSNIAVSECLVVLRNAP
ncbi:hypothetical protein C8J57DRAFT_1060803, partial [Mycena rebaudengoi]